MNPRNESLKNEMKRVTKMYLHMMSICLNKFDEKNVMDDDLFIYEPVYIETILCALINPNESRFRVRLMSTIQTPKSQGKIIRVSAVVSETGSVFEYKVQVLDFDGSVDSI
jgi:hypothetical protein